jgi:hypothetical protein
MKDVSLLVMQGERLKGREKKAKEKKDRGL